MKEIKLSQGTENKSLIERIKDWKMLYKPGTRLLRNTKASTNIDLSNDDAARIFLLVIRFRMMYNTFTFE